MLFSKSCIYAMRAVMGLAELDEGVRKGGKELAGLLEIPEPFLAKILQVLAKHRVITSAKGPNGGFFMTEAQRETPMIRVVEVVDGLHELKRCLMGIAACSHERPCPLHTSFAASRADICEQLKTRSILDMAWSNPANPIWTEEPASAS